MDNGEAFIGFNTASTFDVNLVSKIARRMVDECAKNGEEVSYELTLFILKIFILSSKQFFHEYPDTYFGEENILQVCCKKLLAMESPSIDTVKMQLEFDGNYVASGTFFVEHRKSVMERLVPLEAEIKKYRSVLVSEMELLYGLLLEYVIQRTGLGEAKYFGVKQESSAALQSVFTMEEMESFCSLSDNAKDEFLDELAETVAGIRLFHYSSGRGGSGIQDVPNILNECIPSLLSRLENELCESMKDVTSVTGSFSAEDVNFSVANMWQYIINCAQLSNEVKAIEIRSKKLQLEYGKKQNLLHQLIYSKVTLPAVRVFPQFVKAFKIWNLLQEELIYSSELVSLFTSLKKHAQQSKVIIRRQQQHAEDPRFQDEHDGLPDDYVADDCGEEVMLYSAGVIKNLEEIVLYYEGFCPWMLVEGSGMLKPAVRELGVVVYREKCYGFSCIAGLKAFAQKPEHYRQRIKDFVLEHPEFILLLGMERELHVWLSKRALHSLKNWPAIKVDSWTQTNLHPCEQVYTPRRQPVVEVSQQGVQTANSVFRATSGTQSCFQRDVQTQTRREGSTQTLDGSAWKLIRNKYMFLNRITHSEVQTS